MMNPIQNALPSATKQMGYDGDGLCQNSQVAVGVFFNGMFDLCRLSGMFRVHFQVESSSPLPMPPSLPPPPPPPIKMRLVHKRTSSSLSELCLPCRLSLKQNANVLTKCKKTLPCSCASISKGELRVIGMGLKRINSIISGTLT